MKTKKKNRNVICSNILCLEKIKVPIDFKSGWVLCGHCGYRVKILHMRSKKTRNRKVMYATNKEVREWLLKEDYDEIWFKPHTKRSEYVFSSKGHYLATDLWNLFDGMCFNPNGKIVLLQMKTNNWAKEEPIKKFCSTHNNIMVIVFNRTNRPVDQLGKWKLHMRFYKS